MSFQSKATQLTQPYSGCVVFQLMYIPCILLRLYVLPYPYVCCGTSLNTERMLNTFAVYVLYTCLEAGICRMY